MSGRRAVFLDRDGTILVEKEYLADPDQAELIPGAVEGLRALRDAGYALVVVTNQSGIARGLYGVAEYRAVEARLDALLAAGGVRLDASYHCPHHPDFSGPCDCRKPAAGMFRRAIGDLAIDARASWLVGDRLRDLEPAAQLGARAALVLTGYGRADVARAADDVVVAHDLERAAAAILAADALAARDAPIA